MVQNKGPRPQNVYTFTIYFRSTSKLDFPHTVLIVANTYPEATNKLFTVSNFNQEEIESYTVSHTLNTKQWVK